jgi:hypothetical protein
MSTLTLLPPGYFQTMSEIDALVAKISGLDTSAVISDTPCAQRLRQIGVTPVLSVIQEGRS